MTYQYKRFSSVQAILYNSIVGKYLKQFNQSIGRVTKLRKSVQFDNSGFSLLQKNIDWSEIEVP